MSGWPSTPTTSRGPSGSGGEPAYRDLVLDGYLANQLPVWGLLAAPAQARVLDENQTPYVEASSDEMLARVLVEEWPHEDLLANLPE